MPNVHTSRILSVPDDKGGYTAFTDDKQKPITLAFMCFQSILNARSTMDATGEDKFHRAYLAQRFYEAKKTLELTAEDIALTKKLIAEAQSAWITLICWQLLENKPQPGDSTDIAVESP